MKRPSHVENEDEVLGRITDLLNAIDVTKENTEELYGIFRTIDEFDFKNIEERE